MSFNLEVLLKHSYFPTRWLLIYHVCQLQQYGKYLANSIVRRYAHLSSRACA